MTSPLLTIQDVDIHYGTAKNPFVAIHNLDLRIEEREFVCILGPSGCGKSSLLSLLAGFIKPSRGLLTLDGHTISGPDWQRGVVFQNPALYPWLNVEDNIGFGPKMRGIPDLERSLLVRKSLHDVRMDDSAKKYPYELSGGMRQRVAIARAIANKPRILLMDEPLGALDAFTREQMQVLIRNIWSTTHTTIVLVTHDIDEALLLATRILVLSHHPGTIIAQFTPEFTLRIQEESHEFVRHTADYIAMRRNIDQLIHGGANNFTI